MWQWLRRHLLCRRSPTPAVEGTHSGMDWHALMAAVADSLPAAQGTDDANWAEQRVLITEHAVDAGPGALALPVAEWRSRLAALLESARAVSIRRCVLSTCIDARTGEKHRCIKLRLGIREG